MNDNKDEVMNYSYIFAKDIFEYIKIMYFIGNEFHKAKNPKTKELYELYNKKEQKDNSDTGSSSVTVSPPFLTNKYYIFKKINIFKI